MSQRLIVTGSSGRIGTVVVRDLTAAETVSIDLPDFDVSRPGELDQLLRPDDVVMHLAWRSEENYRDDVTFPENRDMVTGVLDSAERAGVKRVVMASSIHIHGFVPESGMLTTDVECVPASPYGHTKVWIEDQCRQSASRGMDVIALRFGGVNSGDVQPEASLAKRRWLTHRDLITLTEACVVAKPMPGRFDVIWAVSNNSGRYHSIDNTIGWRPGTSLARPQLLSD